MRPMKDDNKLRCDYHANEGELKKTNIGSMLTRSVGWAVMVVNLTMKHSAKITKFFKNDVEVYYDTGSVNRVLYNRMIPVLDNDIPCTK